MNISRLKGAFSMRSNFHNYLRATFGKKKKKIADKL